MGTGGEVRERWRRPAVKRQARLGSDSHSQDSREMAPASDSLYAQLGLDSSAKAEDIKRAYKKLALKHHPDKGGDVNTFKKIANAYHTLSDPNKRKLYDQTGDANLDDFDFEDFLKQGGLLDEFFEQMMMGEDNIAQDMIDQLGGAVEMEDLNASFKSFFKASMGLDDGPVLMPDGTELPSSAIPSMAQLNSMMGDSDDDELIGAMAAMMSNGSLDGGFPGVERGLDLGILGAGSLKDMIMNDLGDVDAEDIFSGHMGRRRNRRGRRNGRKPHPVGRPPQVTPPVTSHASTPSLSKVDSTAPAETRWFQAAKIGDERQLRTLFAASPELACLTSKGIGHTALHWAAAGGHADAVAFLIDEAHISANVLNGGDSTPLHSAAGSGRMSACKALVSRGADVGARDSGGATALDLAQSRGMVDVVEFLRPKC